MIHSNNASNPNNAINGSNTNNTNNTNDANDANDANDLHNAGVTTPASTATTTPAIIPAQQADPLLEVRDLKVAYGKVEAITGLSLRVGAGKIVTMIGPNGAGKTTTLAAIMGFLPAQGQVTFDGEALHQTAVEYRVGRGLTLVPEKRDLFGTMTIEDNLLLGAFMRHRMGHRDAAQTLQSIYALFPRLKERRKQAAGTLSGGERQMLAVGRALMGKPKLLMLDEPSLGLAPLIVREVFRNIAQLREQGMSILLVEQNARAALQVADYAYVLENGAIKIEGEAEQLRHDQRVIDSYLGLTSKHQEMLST